MFNFAFNKLRNIFIQKNKNLKNNRFNMFIFAMFSALFWSFFAYIFCQGQNLTYLKKSKCLG